MEISVLVPDASVRAVSSGTTGKTGVDPGRSNECRSTGALPDAGGGRGSRRQPARHAASMIRDAAVRGAQVVLLPECCDVGWTHPLTRDLAEPVPGGATFGVLTEAARAAGVMVCVGLAERSGDSVYNTAVLIGADGSLLLIHRKLNELDIGHPYYDRGDRVGCVDTPFGRLGVMICADGFARGETIARALGYQGADVILSPWTGHRCIGCSLVVDERGEPVVMLPYGETAETLELVEVRAPERPNARTPGTRHPVAGALERVRCQDRRPDRRPAPPIAATQPVTQDAGARRSAVSATSGGGVPYVRSHEQQQVDRGRCARSIRQGCRHHRLQYRNRLRGRRRSRR